MYMYLYGRYLYFTILSDHKPFRYLFEEAPRIPTMAYARVQSWALTLSAYNYNISQA